MRLLALMAFLATTLFGCGQKTETQNDRSDFRGEPSPKMATLLLGKWKEAITTEHSFTTSYFQLRSFKRTRYLDVKSNLLYLITECVDAAPLVNNSPSYSNLSFAPYAPSFFTKKIVLGYAGSQPTGSSMTVSHEIGGDIQTMSPDCIRPINEERDLSYTYVGAPAESLTIRTSTETLTLIRASRAPNLLNL